MDAKTGESGNGGWNNKNTAAGLGLGFQDDKTGVAKEVACPITRRQVAQACGDLSMFVTGGDVSWVDIPLVPGISGGRRIGTSNGVN